jgi:ribonuclease HIII
MEKFSREYGFELPKGSSESVVIAGRRVVKEKGEEELRIVAKLHHKTTHKIIEKK